MCLSSTSNFKNNDYIKNKIKKGIGWKVFGEISKTYVITDVKNKYIERGKWVNDDNNSYIDTEDTSQPIEIYRTGFHIFLFKKDAKAWNWTNSCLILPVKYKNVVATGYQHIYNPVNDDMGITIVAKDIYVP